MLVCKMDGVYCPEGKEKKKDSVVSMLRGVFEHLVLSAFVREICFA